MEPQGAGACPPGWNASHRVNVFGNFMNRSSERLLGRGHGVGGGGVNRKGKGPGSLVQEELAD